MKNKKTNTKKNTNLPLAVELPKAAISTKLSAQTVEFFKKEYLSAHKQLNDQYNAKEIKASKYLKLLNKIKKQYIKNVNGKYVSKVSIKHNEGEENLLKNKYAFERYVSWRKKNEAVVELNAKIKELKYNFNGKGSYKDTNEYKTLALSVQKAKEQYKKEIEMQKKAFTQAVNKTKSCGFAKWFNKCSGNWKAYINTGGGVINRLIFIVLILIFLILGLVDQIVSFLLLNVSIGSLSVFTFIASILFLIYIVALVIIFFKKRQGIYDVFEAKYAKTSSSSSGPVGSSSDPLDYWSYLEELFIEPEKQEEILPSFKKPEKKTKASKKATKKTSKK